MSIHVRSILFLVSTLISCGASAVSIVIDADDFLDDSVLTNSCKYATLSTSDGGDVYASPISSSAANGNNTLAIGHKVFGSSKANEWFMEPSLEVTFKAKTTRFSILIAELYFDAGPGSEPLEVRVFDELGNFLSSLATDDNTRVTLGEIEPGIPEHGYWAYWKLEYSAASIGKIVLGGDSEPTTFDRLEFDCIETQVPEPSAAILLLIAATGLSIRLLPTIKNTGYARQRSIRAKAPIPTS